MTEEELELTNTNAVIVIIWRRKKSKHPKSQDLVIPPLPVLPFPHHPVVVLLLVLVAEALVVVEQE